ncbi:MAG: NAD-dependent deacylase [Bacteroidetes bacterium]|nr:NAD-dependent deacylase [Bacteroidota bacterium]
MIINPTPAELAARFTPDSKVVVLTGAGVSAESGIATFRDKTTGLWSKFNPKDLADFTAFLRDPELVWQWYQFRKDTIQSVLPNAGHFALVEMQKLFGDFTLVTQNIDNLHQRAGSTRVLELHGNIERNYCISCGTGKEEITELPPRCDRCGGLVRPDVVWFGEQLPVGVLENAFRKTDECTIFMVIGTSAEVYPAARLPFDAARQGKLVMVINPEETPVSVLSGYHVFARSGEFLPLLVNEIRKQFETR